MARGRRFRTRLRRTAKLRPLRGAAPLAALALLLAACAPALSAAPASGATGTQSATQSAAQSSPQSATGSDAATSAGSPAGTTTAAPTSASQDAETTATGTESADTGVYTSTSPSASPSASTSTSTSASSGSSTIDATTLADAAPAASAGAADPPAAPAAPSAGADGLGATVQQGLASWYGPHFAGRLTSDGEIFDPSKLTAAHRTLPFGTLVKVTNMVNGRSVVVRINDRGPFKPNRIIDLSRGAAEAIGMVSMGVAEVRLEPLSLPDGVVRLAADASLHGYQVLSRFHRVGQLLLLSKRNGAHPVVVRVVGTDVPPESGADVLVPTALYDLIGGQAHVQDR